MYMHKYSSLVHSVSGEDSDSDDSLQIDSPHLTEFDSPIKRVGTSLPAVPLR